MPLDAVVAPFRGRMTVRLIEQTNAGPAHARNTGARHASGAVLAFTDDDCTPRPDWLSTLHARARQNPEQLVGGHTVNALPDNVYATASQLLIDYLYAYHATRGAAGDMSAPAFFSLQRGSGRSPADDRTPWRAVPLVALLGVSQIANVLGFMSEQRRAAREAARRGTEPH